MSQRFAIVQSSLAPLDGEKLRRAFRGIPGLAPYDAGSVCNEGGILCRGFSADQASALHANLKAEGLDVVVVEESQLPELPPAKIIRRVELKPEALFIEDLVKGMLPVAWEQIRVIAAGSVQLTKLTRKHGERDEAPIQHIHIHHGYVVPVDLSEPTSGYVTKETVDWFLRAEILTDDGGTRYSIEAERFNFVPLGEGVTRDLAGNFCVLVRGLAAHAPNARLNRGAAAIVSDPCEFSYYPRRSAFHDDIAWMLWKAQRAGDQPQPGGQPNLRPPRI